MTNPTGGSADIASVLRDIEGTLTPLEEHEVASRLRRAIPAGGVRSLAPDSPEFCEVIAFDFHPEYGDLATGWGTYFGPFMVMPDASGQMHESPSIQLVTPAVLSFWETRANSTPHPVLRARYADLIWDLTRKAVRASPNVAFAHIAIDSYSASATLIQSSEPLAAIRHLRRALSIARMIHDTGRWQRAVAELVSLEDAIGEDDKLGLWGFCFDILLDPQLPGLPPGAEARVIQALEDRLARICGRASVADGLDPHGAQAASERLGPYYRRSGRHADAKRVVTAMGESFLRAALAVSPLVGSAWLKNVFDIYLSFGMKAEADALGAEMQRLGKAAVSELKPISAEFEIPREELEEFFAALLAGSLEETLVRIAGHFVQQRTAVEAQLKDLSKTAPISFLMTHTIVDGDGRPLATIGSLADDLEGNVVRQIAQNLDLSGLFVVGALERLRDSGRLTVDSLAEFLERSPAYSDTDPAMLRTGLASYFSGDYLVALHLLIPRLEGTIRTVGRLAGAPLYRPNRDGGLFHRTLDDLLREPAIEGVFGRDTLLYLRVLLTDLRGWNLRNNVSHGLAPASAFNSRTASRVIHAMLVVALVRSEDEPTIDKGSESGP